MKRNRTETSSTDSPGNATSNTGEPKAKQPKTGQDQRQLRVEDALTYLDQVKQKFKDRPDVYNKFLNVMKEFKSNQIDTPGVIAKVTELFQGTPSLLIGFNNFLPPGYTIEVDETEQKEETKKKSQEVDFDQAINYVTKIKTRFNDEPDVYKTFLDILHTYQKEQTTIKKVYEQVATLFKHDADLLQEFAQFLPYTVNNASQKKTSPQKPQPKPQKTKKQSVMEKRKKASAIASGKESDDKAYTEKRKASEQSNVVKYGPSYRSLVKGYVQPLCSNRTELCFEVLNDELVSVPAGSEESRDQHRKSQFDEILYQCEDDRCELDIVIEQNLSTLKFLAQCQEEMQNNQDYKFNFDSLRDVHKASITRIYAEKGSEILEGLKKNPKLGIAVILKRLKQKDEEWRTQRKELNKFWREIYEKNYQKSLENQSAAFKTLEKKNLSSKAIVQDIDLRSEYNRNLETEMLDSSVHNDILFLLVQTSTPTEVSNIKFVWQNLIIPFFKISKKNKDPFLISEEQRIKQERENIQKNTKDANIKTETVEEKPSTSSSTFPPLVEQPISTKTHKQYFFGNTKFLLLFRYYSVVYEKLMDAKSFALAEACKDTLSTPENHEEAEASLSKAAKTLYHNLISHLCDCLNDWADIEQFEEVARKILGYEAFSVFTVDKLILQLKTEIADVFANDECKQLLDAYTYERRRVNSFVDKSYFLHVHKVLNNATVYYFKMNYKKKKLTTRVSFSDLLDQERQATEMKGLQYIEGYIHEKQSPPSKIFLNRCAKKVKEQSPQKVDIVNGLECKICIGTHKIFYVEDTEDFLLRAKQPKQQNRTASTSEKLDSLVHKLNEKIQATDSSEVKQEAMDTSAQ